MSTIIHTKNCQLARAKEREELAAYEKKWSGYCRKCGAEGGRTDWEYRGECHGVPASEQVYNYCPACIGQGRCPRCNRMYDNNFSFDLPDGKLECSSCGWTEGMPGAPEVLNPGECGCNEDSLTDIYDMKYLAGNEL